MISVSVSTAMVEDIAGAGVLCVCLTTYIYIYIFVEAASGKRCTNGATPVFLPPTHVSQARVVQGSRALGPKMNAAPEHVICARHDQCHP